MKGPEFHSHTCTICDWDHCYCYVNPCPHRYEAVNTYTCGFCLKPTTTPDYYEQLANDMADTSRYIQPDEEEVSYE